MRKLGYSPIPEMTADEVEAAITRNVPDDLLIAVLSAALYSEDLEWAQSVCLRLATHQHFNVRGNAILGFGHLARIHGRLDATRVQPVIEAGLRDSNQYIRGQSECAADDANHFLGWSLPLAGEAE